jgi:hypothetical protein
VAAAATDDCVSLADALKQVGIEDADLSEPVRADRLGDQYVWKQRSSVLARVAGPPAGAVEALSPHEIPSIYLCEQIERVQRSSPRAEGGNSDDASLVCMSFYAAVTTVDKRTADATRQVRSHSPDLHGIMGPTLKVPTLEALETLISRYE